MLIYKIFRADEWAHLQENGETQGAPIDLTDGYIHISGPREGAPCSRIYSVLCG